MPDANGHFRGMSVPGEAWERIFGGSKEELLAKGMEQATRGELTDGPNLEKAEELTDSIPDTCCDSCREGDMHAGEGDCGSRGCCGLCFKADADEGPEG